MKKEFEEQEHVMRDEGSLQWIKNIFTLYDKRTMFVIALQCMSEGGSPMMLLCITLFLLEHHIEPTMASYYICIVVIPEALSVFWGLFAD